MPHGVISTSAASNQSRKGASKMATRYSTPTFVDRTCPTCGNTFQAARREVERGKGIYCSKKCFYSSEAFKSRISQSTKTNWSDPALRSKNMEGLKRRSESEEWRNAPHFQKGAAHPKYKGNVVARREGMSRYEYKKWRLAVYQRDGYVCQDCKTRGGRLVAHHIKTWADHRELRYEVSNGITLCEACHDKRHGLKRRARTYKCVDCGKPKKDGRCPRCHSCASKRGYPDRMRAKLVNCEYCQTPMRRKSSGSPYCSFLCRSLGMGTKVIVHCHQCGKELLRSTPSVRGHKHIFCDRTCKGIFSQGKPRGWLSS